MVKITGPIVDTPQTVVGGKVYKKMIYGYNINSFLDYDWRGLMRVNWYFRYLALSTVFIGFPVQYYLHRLVNSPENKAYWKAKRKADEEKEHKQEWDV